MHILPLQDREPRWNVGVPTLLEGQQDAHDKKLCLESLLLSCTVYAHSVSNLSRSKEDNMR